MVRPIGIDLGTTYCAVAAIDDSGRPEILHNADGQTTTPSVVLFEAGEALVGAQAKAQRAAFPDDVVEFVKRQMGNPDWRYYPTEGEPYTAEGISALLLKKVAADAEIVLGEPVRQVAITVPAYFSDPQRNATRQAGEIAGLEVVAIVNEPTAAAVAFGVEKNFEGTVLVYDLGGGTFDVTLLRVTGGEFEILRTDGDKNLGGFDFDNKIIGWLKAQFTERTGLEIEGDAAEASLRDRAEQAKHRLSSSEQAPVFVGHGGRNEKLILTRTEFEAITEPLLARTQMLLEEVADEAGVPFSAIDKVILVGGSTRMPMVRVMAERVTGKAPDQSVHPDEAVARGAAIIADLRLAEQGGLAPRTESRHELAVLDVVSHGLGVVALNDLQVQSNSVVIPSNAKIPCQFGREFSTVADQQTQLLVEVTEGDDEDLRYVRKLGNSTLRIPPYPAGAPIRVVLSCDIDGILHIEVFDLTGNTSLGEFEIEREANLGQAEVNKMRDAVARVEVS
jgi:molecular chaperone DnaK